MSEINNQIAELANRTSRSTVAVIDAMVQRGAVRGEELSTIGQLRDHCIQLTSLCEQKAQEEAAESE